MKVRNLIKVYLLYVITEKMINVLHGQYRPSEMLHDNKKKTIYYDNALIKVYDIPIFYIPKLSHPDPTVKRRSGFLIPSLTDSKNLGSGFSIPYFSTLLRIKILHL